MESKKILCVISLIVGASGMPMRGSSEGSLERLENLANARNMENAENANSLGNLENVENVENAKKLENLENVENVENAKDVENIENTKALGNVKDLEDLNNLENVENTKNLENLKNLENTKNLENARNVENARIAEAPVLLAFFLLEKDPRHPSHLNDQGRSQPVKRSAEESSEDLETAAGTNVLRPLFVYRQQLAYRQRIRDAIRQRNRF